METILSSCPTQPADDRALHLLWPVLYLARIRPDLHVSHELAGRVVSILRAVFLSREEDYGLDQASSPLSVDHVLSWLNSVWQTMGAVPHSRLLETRRRIMDEIMRSDLSSDEQSVLLSALDYLYRLSSARRISTAGGQVEKIEVPVVKSTLMQAVYRKIAELAATDLPIWLSGEKGSEFRWAADLIHQLRGLEKRDFHVWNPEVRSPAGDLEFWQDLEGRAAEGPEITLYVEALDRASEPFLRALYGHLLGQLRGAPRIRFVVTSRPVDPVNDHVSETQRELFGFLLPTRIAIPPLRKRIEDLEGLLDYFSGKRERGNTYRRLSPDALDILQTYHWPGNTEELEVTSAILARRRPAGEIRLEHIPETLRHSMAGGPELLEILETIYAQEKFRVLKDAAGRRRLAQFLSLQIDQPFSSSNLQKLFGVGRDTARRLLVALERRGVTEGITGAKGARKTRYRCLPVVQKFDSAE